MPVQLSIDINAPAFRNIPDKYDDAFLDGEVKAAAEWVRSVWVAAVSGSMVLPGMSGPVDDDEYARSLGLPSALRRTGKWEYTITAKYDTAQRIEQGFGSYDMKPALLGGPHAKPTADGQGKYNVVPYRFGTPILRGPNKGQSRPNFPGEMTMPKDVYKEVKDGERYADTGEGQRTKIPLLFSSTALGGVNAQAIQRNLPAPMTSAYTWRSGLYDGMVKKGKGGHSQYFTFRAVSTPRVVVQRVRGADGRLVTRVVRKGSDPNAWMHPGQGANPVMQAVRDYTHPFVERMLLHAASTI